MIPAEADPNDHWFREIFFGGAVRGSSPPRPTAKHLQNEFLRAIKKHGAPEVSGGALSLTDDLTARTQRALVAIQASLSGCTLRHVMYARVGNVRVVPSFNVFCTKVPEEPGHADLVAQGAIAAALSTAATAVVGATGVPAPKTEIEGFRRLAEAFTACDGTDLSPLEALRSS